MNTKSHSEEASNKFPLEDADAIAAELGMSRVQGYSNHQGETLPSHTVDKERTAEQAQLDKRFVRCRNTSDAIFTYDRALYQKRLQKRLQKQQGPHFLPPMVWEATKKLGSADCGPTPANPADHRMLQVTFTPSAEADAKASEKPEAMAKMV